MLDFKLEELRAYQGSSPRPKDFDDYWERALRELDGAGTGYTLEPAEFSVFWFFAELSG